MNRNFLRWLLCLILAMPLLSLAASGEPAVPEQTGLVVDETGLLDEEAQHMLLGRLAAIQAAERAQVAILVAGSTHGEALADYSLHVAESWKLGHAGRDDGLLIVLVPSQAAARIEVGYGLEGAIPDLRASQWIDELLPALKSGQLAQGLRHLLDQVEAALPAAPQAAPGTLNILDAHPDWKLPFVLAIFSPFALFPLFIGRWGTVISAPLFAAFIGMAAWMLWNSQPIAIGAAGAAFVLPPLWSLNGSGDRALSAWLQYAKHAGNLAAVAIFFAVITMFVGAGLSGNVEETWAAPLFAGALALGLAVFLFPGRPAKVLMLLLRSFMHFLFILVVAWLALAEFIPDPAKIAFTVAVGFTALIALSLYLDHRETQRTAAGTTATRWSLWLMGIALLIAFPFGALLLVQSVLGADFHTRLAQAAAGGGSLGGLLWWAARQGLFAAVAIGLGGRFGGGGAEGRG